MDECACDVPELAINPARECSRCKGFIDFDDMADFEAWAESLRDRQPRCFTCWHGIARCFCVDNGTQPMQLVADAAE